MYGNLANYYVAVDWNYQRYAVYRWTKDKIGSVIDNLTGYKGMCVGSDANYLRCGSDLP